MNKVEALVEHYLNSDAEVDQSGVISDRTLNLIFDLIDQMTEAEVNQAKQLYRKLNPWRAEGSTG